MVIASAQITIVDSREFEISSVAPANPAQDMLWLDTSADPPVEKIYDNGAWVVINDVEDQIAASPTISSLSSEISQAAGDISLIAQEVWTDGTHATTKLSVAVDGITQTISNVSGGLQSQITQNADKISWVIEGDSTTQMQMTDGSIRYISENVDLTVNDNYSLLVNDLSGLNTQFAAFSDGVETRISDHDELLSSMSFSTDGLKIQMAGSIYYTLTDDVGYHIYRENKEIASFTENKATMEELQIGDIICKKTSKGGWVWTEATV